MLKGGGRDRAWHRGPGRSGSTGDGGGHRSPPWTGPREGERRGWGQPHGRGRKPEVGPGPKAACGSHAQHSQPSPPVPTSRSESGTDRALLVLSDLPGCCRHDPLRPAHLEAGLHGMGWGPHECELRSRPCPPSRLGLPDHPREREGGRAGAQHQLRARASTGPCPGSQAGGGWCVGCFGLSVLGVSAPDVSLLTGHPGRETI